MSSIKKDYTNITVNGVSYKTHSIDSIKKSQLNGRVFNLEVESNNSYLVGSYIVHNCDD
jgi:hypothetical protein